MPLLPSPSHPHEWLVWTINGQGRARVERYRAAAAQAAAEQARRPRSPAERRLSAEGAERRLKSPRWTGNFQTELGSLKKAMLVDD